MEWQTNQKSIQLPAGNAFPLQNEKKFASAIKLLCRKIQRSRRTWNSRTRKPCSAKPLKGGISLKMSQNNNINIKAIPKKTNEKYPENGTLTINLIRIKN